jgi:RNA polymerase-binding protein DksA
MNRQTLNEYRELLLDLRQRVGGEVNRVVEAIQEGVNVNENISSAPVHLADVASETVDANVTVLQTERGILDDINTALDRIADGSYGQCTSCGAEIPAARLRAIPYTALCVKCAREEATGPM